MFFHLCFDLIHGLAFASTLDRLGLARWDRISGVLAFNLGIETMHMVVVAVTLPSLLILSRTGAYLYFRIAGTVLAGLASLAWISERLFAVQTPVDSIVNTVSRRGLFVAALLLAASLACRYLRAVVHSFW